MLLANNQKPHLYTFLVAVAELCSISKGHLQKIQAPNYVVCVRMI